MRKICLLFAIIGLCSFQQKKKKIKIPEGFVYILTMKVDLEQESFAVPAFFMLQHEVTNGEYREFIMHVKSDENPELLKKVLPDTAAWKEIGGFMDPFTNMYFWHPAYENYPVVNVSKPGMELYCEWLTKKLSAEYGNHLKEARLPNKHEWIAAARGGGQGPYPWKGPYVRNSTGCFLANFQQIGDRMITVNQEGEYVIVADSIREATRVKSNPTSVDVTAVTNSYFPNGFGLYNMSGNVAEACAENLALGGHWRSTGYDIRTTSEIPFKKANPFVGFRPVISYSPAD